MGSVGGRNGRNAGKTPRAPDHGRARAGTEAKAKARWPLPRLVLLIGAILLAVGLAASLMRSVQQGPPKTAASGVAAVGGPFRLIDQNARAVNEQVLQGKWSAIFFGYTYCPDVCPATLSALKVAKDRLGPKGKDLQVILITVDPARDTPAQLRTYLSSPAFPQPILGLTGTEEQVAAAAKAYKAYYKKNGTGADYLMDHASQIYLMDPKGEFNSLVSTAQGVDSMAFGIGSAMGIL